MERARDVNDATLRTYEQAADVYAATVAPVAAPAVVSLIDAFLAQLGPGPSILEIGSGIGRDADLLEQRGAQVVRSDAAVSFVRRLRAAGHDAVLLNVLRDDLGGPYAGVYANAVFLHIPRHLLPAVLGRLHDAVSPSGVLAFTLKSGDGEEWSDERLGLPRIFAYWRADAVADLVRRSPWRLVEISEVAGETGDWLQVLCRRADHVSQSGGVAGIVSGSASR